MKSFTATLLAKQFGRRCLSAHPVLRGFGFHVASVAQTGLYAQGLE